MEGDSCVPPRMGRERRTSAQRMMLSFFKINLSCLVTPRPRWGGSLYHVTYAIEKSFKIVTFIVVFVETLRKTGTEQNQRCRERSSGLTPNVGIRYKLPKRLSTERGTSHGGKGYHIR